MHSVSFKQFIVLATFFLSSINSGYAYSERVECTMPENFSKSVCVVLENQQNSIDKRRAEVEALQQLQIKIFEAAQLQKRLSDPENLYEVALLDEKLINEMALVTEQRDSSTKQAVASVGSLMVFSYIVKQMYKSSDGKSMLAKLKGHMNPFSKGGTLKTTVNSAFVISLGLSLYNIYNIKRTSSQLDDLRILIKKLNQLRDQGENLAQLKVELTEVETCFDQKARSLVELRLATFENSELVCY